MGDSEEGSGRWQGVGIFTQGVYNPQHERAASCVFVRCSQGSSDQYIPAYIPSLLRKKKLTSDLIYISRGLIFRQGVYVIVEIPWSWLDLSGHHANVGHKLQRAGCFASLGDPSIFSGPEVDLEGWDMVRLEVCALQSGQGVALAKRAIAQGLSLYVDGVESEIQDLMVRVVGATYISGSFFDSPNLVFMQKARPMS